MFIGEGKLIKDLFATFKVGLCFITLINLDFFILTRSTLLYSIFNHILESPGTQPPTGSRIPRCVPTRRDKTQLDEIGVAFRGHA